MVIPEAGEDCERLERDNELSMTGLCALDWMMLGIVGSESRSPRNYSLRSNEMTAAVLQVLMYADSSIAHRCLCEPY